jgi:VWFA-related protein
MTIRSITHVLVLVLSAPVLIAQNPPARFRSGVDAVRVDVQARQGNKPIGGLTAADFEVRDSGIVQDAQLVATGDLPLTLMLALDTSSSVEGEMLRHLKTAARSAVEALSGAGRAALLTFSQVVTREVAPTADRAALGAAIDKMTAEGATSVFDATLAAIALRHGVEGRVVLLVFTDGMDTSSWLEGEQVLDAAVRSDVVIYSVSISTALVAESFAAAADAQRRRGTLHRWFDADPRLFPQAFVEEMTTATGGESFYVRSGADLAPAFAKIVAEFKSRYLLTYSPKNVPVGGWHPIEVKLKNHRGSVQARRGYWR